MNVLLLMYGLAGFLVVLGMIAIISIDVTSTKEKEARKIKKDEEFVTWSYYIARLTTEELIEQDRHITYMQSLGGCNMLNKLAFIKGVRDERGV